MKIISHSIGGSQGLSSKFWSGKLFQLRCLPTVGHTIPQSFLRIFSHQCENTHLFEVIPITNELHFIRFLLVSPPLTTSGNSLIGHTSQSSFWWFLAYLSSRIAMRPCLSIQAIHQSTWTWATHLDLRSRLKLWDNLATFFGHLLLPLIYFARSKLSYVILKSG